MRRTRKRSTRAKRAVAASVALILGGGGLIAANVYASAGQGWGDRPQPPDRQNNAVSTIDCPDVGDELKEVPGSARTSVDRELATMDSQITVAYQRMADNKQRVESDAAFAEQQILTPLKNERVNILQRIEQMVGGQQLTGLAPCTLRADDDDTGGNGNGNAGGDNGDDNNGGDGDNGDGNNGNGNAGGDNGDGDNSGDGGDGDGGDNGDGGQEEEEGQGQAGNGPEASDFVDITTVQPNVNRPQQRRGASRGSFATNCGTNQNGKFNPDNVIVAPGVSNGAHHMHDYVGNQANDAFASDDDLARGQTTCRNQGDRSTYYWPVLRLQNGQEENDAQADGGGKDQNVGEIQTPAQVTLNFVGSPVSRVTAMPRFLRIITGDAKAFTNGDANANASWSCTGFEDRQLKDKYPICPEGSNVVRTFRFQSCWDGQNTDSANHRTHVAFADPASGRCGNGFRAIPQLVQRIVYDVPPGPGFAVDSFPEQLHKPITDHGDFINVFDQRLMRKVVSCINEGRRCS
ncbi:DUF1996 domain-containing protein [Streptomyces sp. Je 1-79]|uniref:DUF1996 domain-containing protein n=1 Tax=Streptomyces sp. Je 1-79 TaxID=2943847 RepID=UPI0021A4DE3F|nr:DUF1996 domain-containing protein [Streptomyces sp. Je 1-79]MCT4353025.1 DUF1996 domain-containing protein [Streptomyces sp. Je 1-79]